MKRRSLIAACLIAPLAVLGFNPRPAMAVPIPNGTRPMKLTNLSVVAISSTRMRISGKYTNLAGYPQSGITVRIWSVGIASFSSVATIFTKSDGTFRWEGNKVSEGRKIQIEVEGNGAYSRPYPTFDRP